MKRTLIPYKADDRTHQRRNKNIYTRNAYVDIDGEACRVRVHKNIKDAKPEDLRTAIRKGLPCLFKMRLKSKEAWFEGIKIKTCMDAIHEFEQLQPC